MDYHKLCKEAIKAAKKAGSFMLKEQRKISVDDVKSKGIHDFVTYVDKQSEDIIINHLSKELPEASFLAEESSSVSDNSDLQWIIDPLDGTTNFIHGLPLYSISIALKHNNKIVLGVIFEPNLKECFYAWENGGAWLNKNQIFVSKTKTLNNSLLATGFPYYDYKHLEPFTEFLKYTILETRGLRRLGSAALDMAWVACGRFEGFYEYGLRAWDIAAGVCLVNEAGGRVSDFKNSDNFLFGKEIIASNSYIHESLFENINDFFFNLKKIDQ